MVPGMGKRFCAEHAGVDPMSKGSENENQRIPCPYDPKHSCYAKKLKKHLKICNSRPKPLPEYIVPGINLSDSKKSCHNEVYSITSVPDDVLVELIEKIETVFKSMDLLCSNSLLRHETVEMALLPEMGMNSKKHLIQNSSLLKNLEENNFLKNNVAVVEFGAGRGQLGFWVSKVLEKHKNCSLLLIDRASHRHKSDNKLKGASSVHTERIRVDIGDLQLFKIPFLMNSKIEVVGVTKHLCGMATDLALRCMVSAKENSLNVNGLVMAFCCHHQCSWSSYVGKKFLIDSGFVPSQFSALCSISSWATCGLGTSRLKKASTEKREQEDLNNDRYKRFGLSHEDRKTIGRKCKMIINQGRLKYLEEHGFDAKLVYYVETSVSPENVCVIAKSKTSRTCQTKNPVN